MGGPVSKLCCLDRDLSKRVVKMGVWDLKTAGIRWYTFCFFLVVCFFWGV